MLKLCPAAQLAVANFALAVPHARALVPKLLRVLQLAVPQLRTTRASYCHPLLRTARALPLATLGIDERGLNPLV